MTRPAGEGSRLRVAPDEARVFLGLNRTESTTSFRFMDLPPEIRNTIYEMALSFPKAGINIRPYKSQNRVHALTKDRIKSVSPLKWFSTPTDYSHDQEIALQGRTLSEYLDMFRTSKQFYAEAMPIFYSTNTFVAIDNNELNVLMKQTPEHRRKHFEHVVFLLHPKDLGYGRRIRSDGNLTKNYSGMEALKRVPDLKKLDVVMWEEEWLAVRKTTKQRAFKYTDILKIPPMPILEQFRGLTKVTFHGNCDTVNPQAARIPA
ncbi:hypothetical protein HII31_09795 [Pseudocercospora fuligena]|uniref:DUF7730 domain-containing protein n=1 Tax=Pseudocercospora fuligena TaxID=685502 RepID=A0A8H6RE88_9PEZI|nr:hypothetical protein HII31_09795 [Pseudocercospora fuligena]